MEKRRDGFATNSKQLSHKKYKLRDSSVCVFYAFCGYLFDSTGYPIFFHAGGPPRIAYVPGIPARFILSAKLALEFSAAQEQ